MPLPLGCQASVLCCSQLRAGARRGAEYTTPAKVRDDDDDDGDDDAHSMLRPQWQLGSIPQRAGSAWPHAPPKATQPHALV